MVGKKYFALNLNIYRNAYFLILNKAKVAYKELIKDQLKNLSIKPPICITYTYYPPDKRKSDLGNILPIHAKFFEDALVEFGCLPDDNYKFIPEIIYKIGSIDSSDPRVEIEIKEYINAI